MEHMTCRRRLVGSGSFAPTGFCRIRRRPTRSSCSRSASQLAGLPSPRPTHAGPCSPSQLAVVPYEAGTIDYAALSKPMSFFSFDDLPEPSIEDTPARARPKAVSRGEAESSGQADGTDAPIVLPDAARDVAQLPTQMLPFRAPSLMPHSRGWTCLQQSGVHLQRPRALRRSPMGTTPLSPRPFKR